MKRDTSKLPKWAQEEIARLETCLGEAAEREAVGPEDSNTFANPYLTHDKFRRPKPLGTGTAIEFVVDSLRRHSFTVRLDDNDDLVMMGQPGLVIRAQSSNVIRARLEAWS